MIAKVTLKKKLDLAIKDVINAGVIVRNFGSYPEYMNFNVENILVVGLGMIGSSIVAAKPKA